MTHASDHIHGTAEIRETPDSATIRLHLYYDTDDCYRWYQAEDGVDTEVSARTIDAAIDTAADAWRNWEFRMGITMQEAIDTLQGNGYRFCPGAGGAWMREDGSQARICGSGKSYVAYSVEEFAPDTFRGEPTPAPILASIRENTARSLQRSVIVRDAAHLRELER